MAALGEPSSVVAVRDTLPTPSPPAPHLSSASSPPITNFVTVKTVACIVGGILLLVFVLMAFQFALDRQRRSEEEAPVDLARLERGTGPTAPPLGMVAPPYHQYEVDAASVFSDTPTLVDPPPAYILKTSSPQQEFCVGGQPISDDAHNRSVNNAARSSFTRRGVVAIGSLRQGRL